MILKLITSDWKKCVWSNDENNFSLEDFEMKKFPLIFQENDQIDNRPPPPSKPIGTII